MVHYNIDKYIFFLPPVTSKNKSLCFLKSCDNLLYESYVVLLFIVIEVFCIFAYITMLSKNFLYIILLLFNFFWKCIIKSRIKNIKYYFFHFVLFRRMLYRCVDIVDSFHIFYILF